MLLVLLDFINKKRAEGAPVVEAIHIACRDRMRPILLTTFTTMAGLAPMALGVGGYSKIWSPFATTIIPQISNPVTSPPPRASISLG